MTIAPILRTIEVAVPPERAFELFSSRMHDWWPIGHSISDDPRVAIEMEPHIGGWWAKSGRRARAPNGARSWPGTRRAGCCSPGRSMRSGNLIRPW